MVLHPGMDTDAVLELESEFMMGTGCMLESIGTGIEMVLGVAMGVGIEVEVGFDIGAGLMVNDVDAELKLELCLGTSAELELESRVSAGDRLGLETALEIESDDPKFKDG